LKKKFYVVKVGIAPGIYDNWDECKSCVEGFSGAVYKSFASYNDAKNYLLDGNPNLTDYHDIAQNDTGVYAGNSNKADEVGAYNPESGYKNVPRANEGEAIAYTDGSYDVKTGAFSYGVVLFLHDKRVNLSKKVDDEDWSDMRNVAGEIFGAVAAIKYCLSHGIGRIVIHHDYEGVAKWCLGEWKANKEGTKKYKAFCDDAKSRMDIEFVKVLAHSGDEYNDAADLLAKSALGL